jgi:DNA polymerase-3 subunit delta'
MTNLLARVAGQDTALEILRRALRTGRVHHAYLFDGPPGVGKELTAWGLAQALVCEAPTAEAEACGTCSACVRAVPEENGRPKHPDLHLLGRGVYEPAQIGRRTPESQDLSIDQIRTVVLARAAFPPHEGRARVYVVRDADELSTSAANAFLKVLEEPTARTHFILITSRADALLSTIRSRTQRVRFGGLPASTVEEILRRRGIGETEARAAAALAEGSAHQALGLADPRATSMREDFVARALEALAAPTLSQALALADDAKKAKDDLPVALEALGAHFAHATRKEPQGRAAIRNAALFEEVQRVLRELDRNASTQLAVESFFVRARALT